jgi:2-pyrone-4,6-dicarboxylate lactonase
VRFNFVKRLVDFHSRATSWPRSPCASSRSAGTSSSTFEARDLPELWDFFTALPTTVVVDHMGRPDVTKPIDGPEFELFLRLMREHDNVWTKVSCPERLSASGPPALGDERAPTATSCRSRAAWSKPSRIASSGEPTGRTRT